MTPARETADSALTSEEVALLSLLATGLTDASVAERLGWAPRLFQRRLRSAMDKLGVASRFQAGYAFARSEREQR